MLEEITCDRRRFLGGAAMTIVAAQLGMIGCAKEQSSEETQGALISEETTTNPDVRALRIDVDEQGNGTVSEQRLYQLIRQPKPIADRHFEIEFLESGVEAYCFTFG